MRGIFLGKGKLNRYAQCRNKKQIIACPCSRQACRDYSDEVDEGGAACGRSDSGEISAHYSGSLRLFQPWREAASKTCRGQYGQFFPLQREPILDHPPEIREISRRGVFHLTDIILFVCQKLLTYKRRGVIDNIPKIKEECV